ncbi:MAG: hypothetical protein IJS30_01240 [Bacteroidales bacterium]|nr:hypothetical protein [Bacteroidales bacterium]
MPNIKIYTRSFSPELYKFSKALYPEGVEAVRMTDRTADGYFYAMLRDTDCDIAINIDEDAYVSDPEAVMELAQRVYEEGWANAGTSDCGPGCPRSHNPIVTNPFFNILNLKLIREKYMGPGQIRAFDYQPVKEQMKAAFKSQVSATLTGGFDIYDFEPYYSFYLWLAYNFKTLYLPAERHPDGLSTILYDGSGRELCRHSWMARKYKVNPAQTQRITTLIDEVYTSRGLKRAAITRCEHVAFAIELAFGYIKKAFIRISRWPGKIKRKINHYRCR